MQLVKDIVKGRPIFVRVLTSVPLSKFMPHEHIVISAKPQFFPTMADTK